MTADRDQQWRLLVAGVAASRSGTVSADPVRALVHTTIDGIDVQPLYTAEHMPYSAAALGMPGQSPFIRGYSGEHGWDARQRYGVGDANQAIREDLGNGVSSIWLGVAEPDGMMNALEGIDLATTPVALDAGPATLETARALLHAEGGPLWRGTLGADPIGWANRDGIAAELDVVVEAWRLSVNHRGLRAAVVDGTVFHDAGASDVDEVGIATAAGVAYLRELTGAGFSMVQALSAVEFRFAVTQDQFASVAKLRAARRVWARIGELCGAHQTARGQRQHAVTSSAMMTRRDPYVNVLRAAVAGFAGALGGAQVITVTPFDAAIGMSDPLARRIARNTLTVLHDEVSLARVADPAGGSWYVESRTEAIARRAWDVFTTLERRGGPTNLAAVAEIIASTRSRRDALIASGEWPIIGVNRFPNPDEQPLIREPMPARDREESGAGLPRTRYAEFDEQVWPA